MKGICFLRRIPLVPRRPMSAPDGKDKRAAARGKAKNPDEASPVPPEDIDERLIFDAQKLCFSYVNNFVSVFLSIFSQLFLTRYNNELKKKIIGEISIFSDPDSKDNKEPVEEKIVKTKGAKIGKVVISKSRSPSAKEKDTKAKSPKGKKAVKVNKVEETVHLGM